MSISRDRNARSERRHCLCVMRVGRADDIMVGQVPLCLCFALISVNLGQSKGKGAGQPLVNPWSCGQPLVNHWWSSSWALRLWKQKDKHLHAVSNFVMPSLFGPNYWSLTGSPVVDVASRRLRPRAFISGGGKQPQDALSLRPLGFISLLCTSIHCLYIIRLRKYFARHYLSSYQIRGRGLFLTWTRREMIIIRCSAARAALRSDFRRLLLTRRSSP